MAPAVLSEAGHRQYLLSLAALGWNDRQGWAWLSWVGLSWALLGRVWLDRIELGSVRADTALLAPVGFCRARLESDVLSFGSLGSVLLR